MEKQSRKVSKMSIPIAVAVIVWSAFGLVFFIRIGRMAIQDFALDSIEELKLWERDGRIPADDLDLVSKKLVRWVSRFQIIAVVASGPATVIWALMNREKMLRLNYSGDSK